MKLPMLSRLKISPFLFRLPILVYSSLGILYWMVFLEPGMGDEGLMAQYLDEARDRGFYWLLQSGNFSIPHAFLVFPLTFFMPSYLSLRILSLLGTIFILLFLKRKHQLGGNTIVTHLLFYLASGSFFLGTNDNLFVCFLVVFFSEVVLFISRQSDRISGFAWFCLVSAFFTREMAVVYLPLIACMTLFIFNSSKFRPKEAGLVIGSVAFWIVLNIPSIAHHGSLSFDNKEMAKQNGITWPQRQYLSQLYATQGIIPELSHVSWEETRSYLEKNGKDSLPSSTFDSLVFDISFTWKEFWKDFLYLIYSGFRQVGLVIFFPFLMFITPTKENQAIRLIGFGQLLQMLVFSAIIISYIEIRWLAPAFILGILGMDLLLKSREGKAQVDFINQIVLTALSIYGIFAYIHLIGNTRTWLETFF